MSSELRKSTVRSLAIVGSSQAVIKIISFCTTIILARILNPEDYGIMAMAMLVTGFVGFFNEMGMSAAVVQRQNITQRELSGVFYFAIILGVLCWLIVSIASVWASSFFDAEKLEEIIPIIGLGLILGSTTAVPSGLMRKELRFKELSIISIVTALVNACATLLLAVNGFGIWSLVYGSLASGVVGAFLVCIRCGWLPGSISGMRDAIPILSYGTNITATRVIWYIYSNADKAIIGKLLGDKLLGIYSMAFTLASLPSSHITSIVVNVSSPIFSKLQSDPEGLKISIVNFVSGIAHITFPALFGICVVAPELVSVVIGEKWLEVIMPLQILCILGIWKSIDPVLTQVLISTGHANKVVKYTGLCSVLIPAGIFIGSLYYGLSGAALAWIIIYPLVSSYLFYLIKVSLGVSFMDLLRSIAPVMRNSFLMILAVYATRLILLESNIPLYWVLVAEIIVGVLVYLMALSFDKNSLAHMKVFLLDLGIKPHKLGFWPLSKV